MFFVLMNWPVNQFELDPVNIAFSLTGRFTSQEIHGIYTSDPFLLAFHTLLLDKFVEVMASSLPTPPMVGYKLYGYNTSYLK